jgi:molybdopterin synthase sulfur carrier subunit
MARVDVRLFATVREAAGVSELSVQAETVEELLDALSSRLGKAFETVVRSAESDPERLVIMINGRNISPTALRGYRLSDGDDIAIFPPVSGG